MPSSNYNEVPKAGDLYTHFKGMQYRILGVGRHSETLEEMVFYEALYDNPKGKLWARPLAMFQETVPEPGGSGKPVRRFAKTLT